MASTTYIPTANQSPDPGQGGDAVVSPSNTGHASTTSTGTGSGVQNETKTCVWTTFQAAVGQIVSLTLKFEHTSSGTLSGGAVSNDFTASYSLNGGSNWTVAVQRLSFTASQGPTTFSVALNVTQDLSQVRVRDLISATANTPGSVATCTATMSNIRVEAELLDGQVICMW